MSILILRSSIGGAAPIQTGSLVFTGTIDEVTDRLDIDISSGPANVGGAEMLISLWLKANGVNDSPGLSGGSGYLFPNSDIFMDRDNLDPNTRDFGAGLANGRIVFSVENSNGSYTLVGNTDIRGSNWVHAYLYRRASDGYMAIGVGGARDAEATGPTGTISYQGGLPDHARYLVFGTEKNGFTSASGYRGRIGPIAIASSHIHAGVTYSVPTSMADMMVTGVVSAYPMNENGGTGVADIVGTNPGVIAAGGAPAWSTDSPFA